MSEQVKFTEVEPGTELAEESYPVTRLSLVKYCGASGDFNVIHWNERIAKSVGLPDVIAHGMFTMAQAGRYVTDWAGDQAARWSSGSGSPRWWSCPMTTRGPRSRSAARSRKSSMTTTSSWR